ncbi:MAG: HYR domain-containing protein, partial [Verrucomicrobia bacterium]|nr:HYR domain-containing protein [Verrucomicrobiota bacterium]
MSFAANATDNCTVSSVVCLPASGATFPVGTNSVTCVATDSNGNRASCSFMVTVQDLENPQITCPADVVTNTTGACGQVVSFAASATDNCAVSSTVCLPTTGSTFPVGTNAVTCLAADSQGNSASCSFTVTVRDQENPRITCPANVGTNTTGACGQMVSFAADATDNCAMSSLICLPASGATFPVGTNAVTCVATDINGNSASCSFTVTVRDQENPRITCPANVVTNTTGACGQGVSFAASATDNCAVSSTVCLPASGSTFPVGANSVT